MQCQSEGEIIGPGENKEVKMSFQLLRDVKEEAKEVVVEVKEEDKQICKKEVPIKY